MALVDQLLVTAEVEAERKHQIVYNEITDNIFLNTDRQLLLSCLANLIQNAIKYTDENGSIWLRTNGSPPNVIIEIENECKGLDSSNLKSLFKPFVSVGLDQSGLGLGLSIVQKAVKLLQGKIEVFNDPPTRCLFRIEIPREIKAQVSNKPVQGRDAVQPGNPPVKK